jgi:hypothetical protein
MLCLEIFSLAQKAKTYYTSTFLEEKCGMRFLTAVRYGHLREWLEIKIAWTLPKGVVKWAMIRTFAHATTGQYGGDHVDQIGYKEVHDRWKTA